MAGERKRRGRRSESEVEQIGGQLKGLQRALSKAVKGAKRTKAVSKGLKATGLPGLEQAGEIAEIFGFNGEISGGQLKDLRKVLSKGVAGAKKSKAISKGLKATEVPVLQRLGRSAEILGFEGKPRVVQTRDVGFSRVSLFQ